MGFRFSRRIKIAPGLRLNVGLGGVSMSAGVRGASVTWGKHGVHGNFGLPGTGLSYRTRLAGGSAGRAQSGETERNRLLRAELDRQVEAINAAVVAELDVHLATPRAGPWRADTAALAPKPQRPTIADAAPGQPRPVAWIRYAEALAAWRAAQANGAGVASAGSVAARANALEQRLSALAWPRETVVDFELSPDGASVSLDIDLPEIEDLPSGDFRVDQKTLELTESAWSETRRRQLYARHVHAVLFRVVGEVFAEVAGVRRVTAAGYTQRVSKATGRLEDEYIVEVSVNRDSWRLIDFDCLRLVDPIAALERFELNRRMSARGVFSSITPAGL